MAIDKSKWNMNVRVSQKTIDEIKKLGMTKAIKGASPSQSAEWKEGLRRLYTPERIDKLIGGSSTAGKYHPKSTGRKGPSKPLGQYTKSAKPKPPYTTGKNKPKTTTISYGGKGYSGTAKVTKGKDSVSFGEGLTKAAGIGLNAAMILASRGMAGGALAKVAPKLVAGKAGKIVFGKKANAKAKAKIAPKPEPTTATVTKPTPTTVTKSKPTTAATKQANQGNFERIIVKGTAPKPVSKPTPVSKPKSAAKPKPKSVASTRLTLPASKPRPALSAPKPTTKPLTASTSKPVTKPTPAANPNNSGLNANAEKQARELAAKNKAKGSNASADVSAASKNKLTIQEFYQALRKEHPDAFPANLRELSPNQKAQLGAMFNEYLKTF